MRNDHYVKLGIRVCSEWQTFDGFFAEMGDGYKEGLSLDRIDNTKGYYADNCRWATAEQQETNRRNVRLYEYMGHKTSLGKWSKILGIKRDTLDRRILRRGWTVKEAFEIPTNLNNRILRKKWDGHTPEDVLKRLKTL